MPARQGPPRPRTQEERSAATRQAILDAAAERLVASGLDGVTIAAVAKGAGLSTGAVQHHFANKLDLILGLTSHLSDGSKDIAVAAAPPEETPEKRVDFMVDAILRVVFEPATRAQFELHTASRISPALAEHLHELNARNAETYVSDLAVALLAADVQPERLQAALELTLCAAIGLSLLTISGTDEGVEARMAESLKALLRNEISQAQRN